MLVMFGRLTPYVLVTAVFTFLYAFMPNTKVQFRAALIGGLFAGVLWAATGMIFTSFVVESTRTIVIYASFAIVIVALIWLHVSWLILLLGAQLSFYVQNPQYLRPGRGEIQLNASLRERVALSIMYLIVSDYRDCEPSLEHQPARRAPGPAGRGTQSDRHGTGTRQAAAAGRRRDLGAGARPADDRARRSAGGSEARHGRTAARADPRHRTGSGRRTRRRRKRWRRA